MALSCRRGGQFVLFMVGRQLLPVLVLTVALVGQSFGATAQSTKTSVERLVTAAAQAEISGDVSKSLSLLQDAIRIDPENQLVHWQLGQLKVDKQWVTVEEAQRRASADPLQAEYRQRRSGCWRQSTGAVGAGQVVPQKGPDRRIAVSLGECTRRRPEER